MTCFSLRRQKLQILAHSEESALKKIKKIKTIIIKKSLMLSPLDVVLLPGQLGVTLVELVHDQVDLR